MESPIKMLTLANKNKQTIKVKICIINFFCHTWKLSAALE